MLRRVFPSISDETLLHLIEHGNFQDYDKGVTLCHQGHVEDTFFILLSGEVGVYQHIHGVDNPHHIETIQSGTFGELALIMDEPRHADVITLKPSRVMEINRESFNDFIRTNPSVVVEISKVMLERILDQGKRILLLLSEHKRRESETHDILINLVQENNSVFGVPSTEEQFQVDVFMVMPFNDELGAIYKDHIKPTVEGLGLNVKRGDDFFSHRAIMQEIWSVTNNAKLIIGECTGKNANVFYELGMAHTIGKPTIMITQDPDSIPFDLRHLRYITYDYTPSGMKQFEASLSEAVQRLLKL